MAMGTGKSLSAIRIIEVNDAKRVLVLCPSSVVGVWPREFAKHAIEDWTVVDLRSGAVAKRTERAEAELRAASLDERVAVVINYEAAWREPFASFALKQRWDYVVLDEVHRIKSTTGRASKFCWQLGKTAKRRLGLTGTPIPHTILDVFGQYRALDPDVFGTSYTAFKNRYGEWGGFNNYQLTGIKNEDDFNRRFYSIAFRVGSDVLDLPGEHDIDRTCELSPKAKRLYLDLRDEMYGEQDGEPITASNALTRLLRLQQLTGGAVNDDEGGFHEIDDSKAQLLTDVLEDLDAADPVVVFCRFTHDLAAVRRVTEKLGRRYGEVSGQRKDLNADATMPEGIDVLGVQIQAGGLGIDLTRSHIGVYYSLGFSLADYLQSRARLARPGQDDKVLFIHLIAEGTVDEDVYGALSKRQEVVDYILSGLEQSK
jgi:SNF2 family DNA or RNA helicase